jgi:hypothetical protein
MAGGALLEDAGDTGYPDIERTERVSLGKKLSITKSSDESLGLVIGEDSVYYRVGFDTAARRVRLCADQSLTLLNAIPYFLEPSMNRVMALMTLGSR